MKDLSLYWKCQAAGWVAFASIQTFIDVFKRGSAGSPVREYILTGLLIALLGILLTHAMKLIIKSLGLTDLTVRGQIVSLFTLTVFFTLLFWVLFTTLLYIAHGAGSLLPAVFAAVIRLQAPYLGSFLSQCLTFSVPFLVWSLLYGIIHYNRRLRTAEHQQFLQEKELLQLEARALRAQMNPHFIFNCLNSIKGLVQDKETEKGVSYLTTFSKLIRTLFNNADKKEITLFDEIGTCRLYLQLEAMRFDSKFSYTVDADERLDLKSVLIPALIIQPFIENAIWHGVIPKGNGRIRVTVGLRGPVVEIIIDDDGIGREASRQNQAKTNIGHQSKGVSLTQSRLQLDNLLGQRKASLLIMDKKDQAGHATGTTVILKFPLEN